MSGFTACAYILSTVLMTVIAGVSALLAALAGSGVGVELGIFNYTITEVSALYEIEATPAGWAFSIWLFIFVFEILWIAYALSTLCRSTKQGPVYVVAPVLPPEYTLLYSVNQLLLIGWLFLFDREFIGYSSIDLLFIFVTGFICLLINFRRVDKYQSYMQENLPQDLLANRVLVQNGVALYTTWTLVATLLNSAITLTYKANVDDTLSSTIMYILIIIITTLYFVLDVTVWNKYTRYTFTPYIVVIVASLGSLNFNFDPSSSASITMLISIILGIVYLVGKIFRTVITR
ncbi:uncharacterized protein LOC117118107 [Anneissia japonica]|uniref:uncharacterized protein LOC117118107 n=1 Tax=Anneissia japonica TaxID=1529436 RepID=UPI001425A228|nr:uncharacterized protein LOC117118107 [Anneissia japonica]